MFQRKTVYKIYVCCIFLFAMFLSSCSGTYHKGLKDIMFENGNAFTCTFDGIRHDVILDLPEQTEGASLILMLHGYGNNAGSFRETVHMEEQANRRGYAVVYVTGAADPDDVTSSFGWNSGIGNSENDDVAFLCALVTYLEEVYGFDKDKTYAVGFSNGAFMTYRLAVEAQDTFEAIVSVSGKMPNSIWDKRSESNDISVFQITGEKDDVVPKDSDQTAKYSLDPSIETVMGYWAESNGLTTETSELTGGESVMKKYSSEYSSNMVWSLSVKEGRHSWPDKDINGIDTNTLILDFLDELN